MSTPMKPGTEFKPWSELSEEEKTARMAIFNEVSPPPGRPPSANERQVGGRHYQAKTQHWDWVADNDLDYFQGQITKYIGRWKKKGGLQDLEKARHFLDKYIEVIQRREDEAANPGRTYINPDL